MAVEWRDRGLVLSVRPHGEGNALVTLLTEAHGRHAGLVRGGGSRRGRGASCKSLLRGRSAGAYT